MEAKRGLGRLVQWRRQRDRNADAWLRAGRFRERLRRWSRAFEAYDRATDLDPANVAGWIAKGRLLMRIGRPDASDAAFSQAIELESESAAAWRGKTRALRLLDRFEEACGASANAVELEGTSAEGWLERGAALSAVGREEDALEAYARAVELDPDSPVGWAGRGELLAKLQRLEEALEAYERCLKLERRNKDAWLGKFMVLAALGRRAEASEAFRRATGVRPSGSYRETPARSPVKILGSGFGPIAKDFWTARRPLLVPAVAYVAGLTVWSLNATRNDLGPQVAADLQYLVAGVIPAVIVTAAVALLVVWLAAPSWTRDWLARNRPKVKSWLERIAAATLGTSLAASFFLSTTRLGDSEGLQLGLLLTFLGSATLAVFVSEEGWFFNFLWKLWGVIGLGVVLVLAFLFYSDTVYPRLPQSLGGGAPRCAGLDIQTSRISQDTLLALVPAGPRNSPPATARTVDVDILFSRDDVLFVRPHAAMRGETATHELRGGVVSAVVGC